MLKTKKSVAATAITTVGVAGALLGSIAAQADANPSTSYAVNSDGKTFGSASLASSYENEPDMILVQATNGKEGFVKKEDLHAAEGMASTPSEAVAMQVDREQRIERVLDSELDALMSEGSISEQTADGFTAQVDRALSTDGLADASDIEQLLATLVDNPDLERAYHDALSSVETCIPVYDADGTTVIGEFSVG